MKGRINLVAAAFALTALTYGLGRFAYGLLLPHIREDLSLSATGAGWIGGSAFAAYCFGIVFALLAGARLGERRVAVLASLTATCGLALVAVASSGWSLGLAIALAGLSTGLTSPPLAAAVARCLEEVACPKANGAINAGTAAGTTLSGFAVTAFDGGWRELYTLFAVVGAAVTVWLWFAMPAVSPERTSGDLSFKCLTRPGVGGLCASAFLMGAASTAIWTFGANIMRSDLGFADGRVALAHLFDILRLMIRIRVRIFPTDMPKSPTDDPAPSSRHYRVRSMSEERSSQNGQRKGGDMSKNLLLATCICTVLAGNALAQNATPSNQAGVQAIDAKTVKMTFYKVSPADMLASNFIGSEVLNVENDEEIGEIEDLIIDQGKTIRGVVLSVGGFLGLGERRVAVEPGSLVIQREGNEGMRVVSNTTKDELNKAPEFKYENNLRRDTPEAVNQPTSTTAPGTTGRQ